MSDGNERFDTPDHLIQFKHRLPHLARSMRNNEAIKVVAIGSSSTAGQGDIVPYPGRLEFFLNERFPNPTIKVLNKGVAGEEAPQQLSRFDRDVFAERPVLAIWQVGTNAVFHQKDYSLDDVSSAIMQGLDHLAVLPMDVVLMDPQYAPAIVSPVNMAATQRMVSMIAEAGERANVNVFGRFAVMKHWHEERRIPFDQLIDPADPTGLSQSDASTEAVALALSRAIARAAMSNDNRVTPTDHEVPKSFRAGGSDRAESAVPRSDASPRWVDDAAARRVSLLFATTRKVSEQPDEIFSGERETELTHYGRANVRIPEDRRLGEVRLPFELKVLSMSLFRQTTNPRRHFVLQQCEVMPKQEWLEAVRSSEQKEALVFVHGFNVTFLEAVYRCAQIAWDIRYEGIPILFSWASRGLMREYIYDQGSALDARERFIALLSDLCDAGVTKVHILAHSMGNFAALEALANYDYGKKPLGLGEVLMAAPDVDRDHYGKVAPKVRVATDGMTLYASAADWAMTASNIAAGHISRAGDVPSTGLVLVDRVDSIDATAVGTDIFGLNHGTYAEKKSILNDIKLLLTHGIKPPDKRSAEIRGMPEGERPSKWWRYIP
jgi:esterase/lipase superfamily enzyme